MAKDLVRFNDAHQKKAVSVFAVELDIGEEDNNVGLTSGSYLLGYLPKESAIVNAYVVVKTASDAATTNVATIGTAEAGTQIMTAVNLKATGKQGTFATVTDTGTGVPVYLNVTTTGAATAVGNFVVAIEYIEYTKNTGEYTHI